MKRMSTCRIIFCSVALLLAVSTGNAQIHLNGSVAELDPLSLPDGLYEVTLSVWSEAVGGELLWEQRYPDVRILGGELPTHLGRAPVDLEVSGRWLEVLVEGRAAADRSQLIQVSGQVASLDSGSLSFWDSAVESQYPAASVSMSEQNGRPRLALFSAFWGEIEWWTGTDFGHHLRAILRNGGRFELLGGWDASLEDGGGYLILGGDGTTNLVFDDNEIQARYQGAASTLHLNYEGGEVQVGGVIIGHSDARLKQDIRDIEEGLDEVLRLRPVSFAWRREPGRRHLGLVGQEVREVVGDAVYEDEDGTLGIAYANLVPLLICALQEQQTEIERLRADLEELEDRMAGG